MSEKSADMDQAVQHGIIGAFTGTILSALLSPDAQHAPLIGMILGAAIGGAHGMQKAPVPLPTRPKYQPPEPEAPEHHEPSRFGYNPYDRFIFDSPHFYRAKMGAFSPVAQAALLSGLGGGVGSAALQRYLYPDTDWKDTAAAGLAGGAGSALLGSLSAAYGRSAGRAEGAEQTLGSLLDALKRRGQTPRMT